MVKITNGKNTYSVTKGAFESIYANQGYTVVKKTKVDEPAKPKASKAVQENPVSEDEAFVAEMYETPVSKWSKENAKRFAELNGVDISGTKNLDEAKELLRKELEF